MSEFRVEKRRAEAVLTLTTAATVRGAFFFAGSRPTQAGLERVADLLNGDTGFFPFALHADATVIVNCAHIVRLRETCEA